MQAQLTPTFPAGLSASSFLAIKTEVGAEPESQEAGIPRAKREALMGRSVQHAASMASGPGCHQWAEAGTERHKGAQFLPLCSGAKRHMKMELTAPLSFHVSNLVSPG